MIPCEKCGVETYVTDTRWRPQLALLYRRRVCRTKGCELDGKSFPSYETTVHLPGVLQMFGELERIWQARGHFPKPDKGGRDQ